MYPEIDEATSHANINSIINSGGFVVYIIYILYIYHINCITKLQQSAQLEERLVTNE